MKIPSSEKLGNLLLSALFALFILLPGIGFFANWDYKGQLDDGRKLSAPPSASISDQGLTKWTENYVSYFGDRFGFRRWLIYSYNLLSCELVKESPLKHVVMGQEDWLFYYDYNEQQSYLRSSPYPADEALRLSKYFKKLKTWSANSGTEVVFVLIPNKSTVYADLMPQHLYRRPNRSRLNELTEILNDASMPVVNLRGALEDNDSKPLFYKYDSHWNPGGAAIASREIMKCLSNLSDTVPAPRDFSEYPLGKQSYTGDLVKMLGMQNRWTDQILDFKGIPLRTVTLTSTNETNTGKDRHYRYQSDRPDAPTVSIYHDSFGPLLIQPFLAEYFSQTDAYWHFNINFEEEEKNESDFLLFIIVERFLQDAAIAPEPLYWHMDRTLSACAFHSQTGSCIDDPQAVFGVAKHAKPEDGTGFLLFGRYYPLDPGAFCWTFNMKSPGEGIGPVARIEVVANKGANILGQRLIERSDWLDPTQFEAFDLDFVVPEDGCTDIECRIEYLCGAELSIESIALPGTDL